MLCTNNCIVLTLKKYTQATPVIKKILLKRNFLCLCLSHPVFQPRCRGDGDSRLEVHGGLSSSPGGRSLPLPGVGSVPFPRTPTQAPQTILTASQQGVYPHAYTHMHTHTKTHRLPPQTHRDNFSPCCYLLHYLQPPPNLPLLPHPNLLYLVSSKDGGKMKEEKENEEEMEERGWRAHEVDVCRLQRNHNTPPLYSSVPA